MKFNEVPGSTINPVAEAKTILTFPQIEDYIKSELIKIDHRSISDFENCSIRCKNVILKDVLQAIKSKVISSNSEPETINIINNIFDTVEIQFNLLNEIVKEKINNKDLLIIISAIFVAYFKKI
jgi:hypothetical protein